VKSIPGLHKRLKIRALAGRYDNPIPIHGSYPPYRLFKNSSTGSGMDILYVEGERGGDSSHRHFYGNINGSPGLSEYNRQLHYGRRRGKIFKNEWVLSVTHHDEGGGENLRFLQKYARELFDRPR
jgi:hypothetical protein